MSDNYFETSSEGIEGSLNKLTVDKIAALRSKCNYLNQTKFNEVEFRYQQVLNTLGSIELVVETIKNMPKNDDLKAKMQNVNQIVKINKDLEEKLEKEMSQIANKRSDVYPIMNLPQSFGSHDDFHNQFLNKLMPYEPKKGNSSLKHTWKVLLTAGENRKHKLSELGYKNALLYLMRRDAYTFVKKYFNRPLSELVTLLANRFERQKSWSELNKELSSFQRVPGDSLLQNLDV